MIWSQKVHLDCKWLCLLMVKVPFGCPQTALRYLQCVEIKPREKVWNPLKVDVRKSFLASAFYYWVYLCQGIYNGPGLEYFLKLDFLLFLSTCLVTRYSLKSRPFFSSLNRNHRKPKYHYQFKFAPTILIDPNQWR